MILPLSCNGTIFRLWTMKYYKNSDAQDSEIQYIVEKNNEIKSFFIAVVIACLILLICTVLNYEGII